MEVTIGGRTILLKYAQSSQFLSNKVSLYCRDPRTPSPLTPPYAPLARRYRHHWNKQTTRRTVASKLDLARSAAPQFRKKVLRMCQEWMDGHATLSRTLRGVTGRSPVCCTQLHSWAEKRRSPLLASPRQIQLHAPYTGLCILCTPHFTLRCTLMRS